MDASRATTFDPSSTDGDSNSYSSSASNYSRSYEVRLPSVLNLFRLPLSVLLEYFHALPPSQASERTLKVNADTQAHIQSQLPGSIDNLSSVSTEDVSIQKIRQENVETAGVVLDNMANATGAGKMFRWCLLQSEGNTGRDFSHQSYDIQQFARWIMGPSLSLLTTGLYLTFKLTTIVYRVRCLFAAIRALSQKEVHYGSYAPTEQVNAAGNLFAIYQEKMHGPILF